MGYGVEGPKLWWKSLFRKRKERTKLTGEVIFCWFTTYSTTTKVLSGWEPTWIFLCSFAMRARRRDMRRWWMEKIWRLKCQIEWQAIIIHSWYDIFHLTQSSCVSFYAGERKRNSIYMRASVLWIYQNFRKLAPPLFPRLKGCLQKTVVT